MSNSKALEVLKAVQQEKADFEEQIFSLIKNFEESTGLRCDRIEVNRYIGGKLCYVNTVIEL